MLENGTIVVEVHFCCVPYCWHRLYCVVFFNILCLLCLIAVMSTFLTCSAIWLVWCLNPQLTWSLLQSAGQHLLLQWVVLNGWGQLLNVWLWWMCSFASTGSLLLSALPTVVAYLIQVVWGCIEPVQHWAVIAVNDIMMDVMLPLSTHSLA